MRMKWKNIKSYIWALLVKEIDDLLFLYTCSSLSMAKANLKMYGFFISGSLTGVWLQITNASSASDVQLKLTNPEELRSVFFLDIIISWGTISWFSKIY